MQTEPHGFNQAIQMGAYGWRVPCPDAIVRRGWIEYGGDEGEPYAPWVEVGLLDAFLRLSSAHDALQFVRVYGALGWVYRYAAAPLTTSWPLLRRYRRVLERLEERDFRAQLAAWNHPAGLSRRQASWRARNREPVTWILAHAAVLRWCRAAMYRQQEVGATALRVADVEPIPPQPPDLMECWSPVVPGWRRPATVRGRQLSPGTPTRRTLSRYHCDPSSWPVVRCVAGILSAELQQIHRQPVPYRGNHALALLWDTDSLMATLYGLMAEQLVSGSGLRLRPCVECGAIMAVRDPRTRFCEMPGRTHPSGSKVKSYCAERHRQRNRRRRLQEAGLTTRKTTPVRQAPKPAV